MCNACLHALGGGGGGSHHDKHAPLGVVRLLLAIIHIGRISCFRIVYQHLHAWLSANLCSFLPEELRYYSRHNAR